MESFKKKVFWSFVNHVYREAFLCDILSCFGKGRKISRVLDQLLFHSYVITADSNRNRNEFTCRFGPQTEEAFSSQLVLVSDSKGVLDSESELKQNTWSCCCLHPWRKKVNRRKKRHVWTRCEWRNVDSVPRHNSETLRGHLPLGGYKILRGLLNATKQEF